MCPIICIICIALTSLGLIAVGLWLMLTVPLESILFLCGALIILLGVLVGVFLIDLLCDSRNSVELQEEHA